MVMGEFTQETEVLVVGGGPGGYAAAFRAADLGMEVTLIDMRSRPGGVCLFRGCIPSKTLLHVTELLHDARLGTQMGISFQDVQFDLDKMREWKNRVVDRLAGGLMELCKKRGVQFVQGRAVFEDTNRVRLLEADVSHVKFKHAVIATGSRVRPLPDVSFEGGGRVMGSTGALELRDVPETLLVVGGGYVGVELGSLYAALGSRVTLVEWADRLMTGADPDLVRPLVQHLEEIFEGIHLRTRVKSLEEKKDHVQVSFEGELEDAPRTFDRVLVAVGRIPNTRDLGLDVAGVEVDEKGFIIVDEQRRTSNKRIFAVGDVVGGVMLAHKAMFEGKVAAEVMAGQPAAFDVQAIPAVVYTDPQVAWCGLTEEECRKRGLEIKVTRFPWSASGRAVTLGISKGMTKLVAEAGTGRILGMGIVGRHAGEMISEGVLAVEMGALAEDVALSIHPHPTLSETEGEVAEAFMGSSTHLLPSLPRKK